MLITKKIGRIHHILSLTIDSDDSFNVLAEKSAFS